MFGFRFVPLPALSFGLLWGLSMLLVSPVTAGRTHIQYVHQKLENSWHRPITEADVHKAAAKLMPAYNQIQNAGIDALQANGFHIAAHVTPVPEPSSLLLLSILPTAMLACRAAMAVWIWPVGGGDKRCVVFLF